MSGTPDPAEIEAVLLPVLIRAFWRDVAAIATRFADRPVSVGTARMFDAIRSRAVGLVLPEWIAHVAPCGGPTRTKSTPGRRARTTYGLCQKLGQLEAIFALATLPEEEAPDIGFHAILKSRQQGV